MNTKRFTTSAPLVALVALFALAGSAWAGDTVIYNFGPKYANPNGGLVADSAGNLYGTTSDGTASPRGAVFELSPNGSGGWTETTLFTFDGSDGNFPNGRMILDSKGNLYGTTGQGGLKCPRTSNGCGVVFELSPPASGGGAWTETVLYKFKGGNDLGFPGSTLVFDDAGNLNGTAGGSGTGCGGYGCGGIYRLTPPAQAGGAWTYSVIYTFNGQDGKNPSAILFKNGTLYGTTVEGGHYSYGLFYQLKDVGDVWKESPLYSFNSTDGANPDSLIVGADGNFYGTTGGGGQYNWGTIFELIPSTGGGWNQSVLYTFTGGPDGANPFPPPVFDSAGNLYGTTYTGGNTSECGWAVPFDGCGVVYKLAPPSVQGGSWTESVIYAFTDTAGDANLPGESGVIFGQGGLLYGTTLYGGSGGCKSYLGNIVACGAVYSVAP